MTNHILKRFLILIFLMCNEFNAKLATPKEPIILILGDSLTAGYGIEKNKAYPALIEKKIRDAGIRAKVINAGVSGNTTAGGLRRLNWYFRQRIDYLVIALGGNDGLRGIDPNESKKNLQNIIDNARLKYPDIEIILAGMQVPPNMGPDYSQRFREIFPELASEKKISLIPFLLEKVGGVKELNLPDGIHPNSEGQKIVSNTVWRILEPLLNKQGFLEQ